MKIPARPPAIDATHDPHTLVTALVGGGVNIATDPYRPWEEMRWRTAPNGMAPAVWWYVTDLQRRSARRTLPLCQVDGSPFTYNLPDEALKLIETLRSRAGGSIGMDELVTNPATRNQYLVSSLMEEAITSSQLEGASTTRRVAKDMLRAGRAPRTKDERMIWNNYQAMEFVRAHHADAITPDLVRELHAIVTMGTLDDSDDAGRLQRPGDDRVWIEGNEGEVLHRPPSAEELPARLAALCAFVNGHAEDGPWVSPVVRAILVHFMVGHDHYFVDGNGRLARTLFYWVMLGRGLWLTEFVTISTILKKAPVQYAHAYLNSEYEGDVTYFLLHQLRVLARAFDLLEEHLAAKTAQVRDVREALWRSDRTFNHRQVDLLERAVRDPDLLLTVRSHQRSHRVSHGTARTDLYDLQERGLLERGKIGREFSWRPAPDIASRLGSSDVGG